MPESVILPKLEMDMEEAVLVAWLKKEGDAVESGDLLFEIETAKAVVEVEAEASGTLLASLFEAGETIPVATVIGWIGEPGEVIPDNAPFVETERSTDDAPSPSASSSAPASHTEPTRGSSVSTRTVRATPAARRIAREHSLDLATITPTGVHGEATKRDVEAAAATHSLDPSSRIEPMSPLRRAVAKRMTESSRIPQATVEMHYDATELVSVRERIRGRWPESISLNAFIMHAAIRALHVAPECNASLSGDDVIFHERVHLGIAVASDRGLLVPVLHNAHTFTLRRLASGVSRLAEAARENKLRPTELSGGTFTITNLGMFGVSSFTPILNPPESAILGVCGIEDHPTVKNGQWCVRKRGNLCLTMDHRVMDGVSAARYLQEVRSLLEDPLSLLMDQPWTLAE